MEKLEEISEELNDKIRECSDMSEQIKGLTAFIAGYDENPFYAQDPTILYPSLVAIKELADNLHTKLIQLPISPRTRRTNNDGVN